jgi:hypothetical protein
MNYGNFEATLRNNEPPKEWTDGLKALWYDAKDNWHVAHDLVDGSGDHTEKWIHAYLHRKEGDEWNAGYWYRQAGKSIPKVTLEEEHRQIVEFILNQ